jgi:VCBS repeat-containing protein
MFNWLLSKQIRNNITNYTRPLSGGTDTYPLGALPMSVLYHGAIDYATPASDACMIAFGDKPDLSNHSLSVIALCWYGRVANWDASWLSWWQAHRANIVDAFSVVPYDTTARLVTQWPGDYHGVAFTSLDGIQLTGHQIAASNWYYVACLLMAECCYWAGEDQEVVDFYADRAAEVRTAIQGQFRTTPATWDGVHINWDRYSPQTWTNGAPWAFTWNGGAGKTHIVSDPTDAANQLLKIEDDSASASIGITRTFTRSQYRRQWQRLRTAFMASQTDAAMWLWEILDSSGPRRVLALGLGADGHLKYTVDGSSWANLPVDTTYTADVRISVEAGLDWTTHQVEVLIDGASKGSVAMDGAASNLATLTYRGGVSASDVGSVLHDDMTWYDVPTGGTDTDTVGFLPWTTGPEGNCFSPEATGFAAWAGILTETQALQAGRLMSLYWDKPDYSGVGDGDLFLRRAGLRSIHRHIPWSEDAWHDAWMIYPYTWLNPSTFTIGVFQNGGYLYSYSQWPIYAMSLHSPSRAQTAMGALLDDVGLSTQAPYERVDNGVQQGTNYLQAAVSFLGLVRTTALPQIKTKDGNPLNLYRLMGGEWTLF